MPPLYDGLLITYWLLPDRHAILIKGTGDPVHDRQVRRKFESLAKSASGKSLSWRARPRGYMLARVTPPRYPAVATALRLSWTPQSDQIRPPRDVLG